MKRLLCILLFTLPLSAQVAQFTAPDCQFSFQYSVTSGTITSTTSLSAQRLPLSQTGGNTIGYDNRSQTCSTWSVMYQAEGVGAVSLQLDQAPSSGGVPGSWTVWPITQIAFGGTLPMTSTTFGNITAFTYRPWVSVNLNSATGTGTVYGRVLGWRPAAGQDVASGNTPVVGAPGASDPCQSSGVTKNSVNVGITSATTTQLIAPSGTTVVYVCGATLTIAPSATSADSAQLTQGTGATCGSGTVTLTGTFGSGNLTTAAPNLVVPLPELKPSAAGAGLCLVSAGTTVNIQGVIEYVQQ